ncbi:unnamed protein product [Lota lota]
MVQYCKYSRYSLSRELKTVGVCVDDGWFKQPHLARVRLIGVWSWVRLHTCCTLSNQCAQVKPAITTHSRRALRHRSMKHHLHASFYATFTINRSNITTLCPLVWRSLRKVT